MTKRPDGNPAPDPNATADPGLLASDLRERLASWHAPSPAQDRLREEMLAHVAARPDAVWRSGPPAHVTAGLLVLDATASSVLLTHHRKARRWFQFGGHLERDDRTVLEAAAREGAEESGVPGLVVLPDVVHLDRHALPAQFGRCREHLDVRFVAVAPEGAGHAVSEESLDVRWWPVHALPPGSEDDLGPLVAAALRAVGAPSAR